MADFFDYIFIGNSVRDWLIALVIIGVMSMTIKFAKRTAFLRVKKWAEKTSWKFDDFFAIQLVKTIAPLLNLCAFYIGYSYLSFNAKVNRWIEVGMIVAVTFILLRFITSGIQYFVTQSLEAQENEEVKIKQARGVIIIVNSIIWITGFIFLLNNLGYNVTSVIAGLGIGGIAIALAAQAILGDLFSYFVIFFDKPFEIGDFIIVDTKMGVIEYIGLKTTRVRTLGGEQLIFPNHDLTNSRVHNYKRMEKRRILFTLGVIYETPPEKLRKVPGIVKGIIQELDDVSFDRGHFSSFGDFSLKFEFVYYINSADYLLYMDRNHEMNLKIFEAFSKEGIEFAYPTQVVHVPERK